MELQQSHILILSQSCIQFKPIRVNHVSLLASTFCMIYEKNLSHLQCIKKGIVTQEEEQQLEQALPSTTPPLPLLHQTKPVLYAFKYLNSPDTQRQYPERLKLFLIMPTCQVET